MTVNRNRRFDYIRFRRLRISFKGTFNRRTVVIAAKSRLMEN